MASPCAFAPGRDDAGFVTVTLNPNGAVAADGCSVVARDDSAEVAKCSARADDGSMQARPLRWNWDDGGDAVSATQ
jgi:hypothetical protein